MESVMGGQAEYQTRLPAPPSGKTSKKAEEEKTGGAGGGEKKATKQDDQLVGHWKWHNTPKRHSMKMHLAKNSDLALHVLLAVLINQVRTKQVANDVDWGNVAKFCSPIVITKEDSGDALKVRLRNKQKGKNRSGEDDDPDEDRQRDAAPVDEKDSVGGAAVDPKKARDTSKDEDEGERSATASGAGGGAASNESPDKKRGPSSGAPKAAAAAVHPKDRTESAADAKHGRHLKLMLATAIVAAGVSFGVGRLYGASGGGPLLSTGPLGEVASRFYDSYFPASASSPSSFDEAGEESQPKP